MAPSNLAPDAFVGGSRLRALPAAVPAALRDDFEAFETELREVLGGISPSLTFPETVRWGYTLARKPPGRSGR